MPGGARPVRRFRTVFVAAVLVVILAPALALAQSLEYPVKATYLYKFAPFVEWPSSAFDGPSAPLVICVAGPDPFGAVLDQAVSGQRLGARPVIVRRAPKADRAAGCHILYISGPAAAEALSATRGAPVLTVTDSERGPGASRGVIDFVIRDNKVRFQIDDQAAQHNGLSISSKLLSLAVAVKPRGESR